jgi:hypothetical protein
MTADMFREVAGIGSLEMQLVYFRGDHECQASRWFQNSAGLIQAMTQITCAAGMTQIGKVLDHAKKEVRLRKATLVFVGDAMEENADLLVGSAVELGRMGAPAFMFQEGRDENAERTYREIARLTKGAYCRFDEASARELGKLLRAVAAYAAGGARALEGRKDEASVKLLTQIKKGG